MLNMYKQITIKTLKNQGERNTSIARQIGCHRNTVRNILQREKIIKEQKRDKSSYFDTYKQEIEELLEKGVTRLRTWEILKEEHDIKRTYDSLCKYVRKEFPKERKVKAYGVQVVSPGEEAEADFGYCGLLPNNQGSLSKTWVFILTLSHSRESYYQFTGDQKIGSLIKACENGFDFFGGVPKRLKVDNMRTAVLKNQHYDLQFNQDFLEFSQHCNFVINPCPPYRPEQKGKVETQVRFVKNNFLNGREFKNRNGMENRLYDWMVNYANKRVHGTTKKIPSNHFQKVEKGKLQCLPENKFAFFQRASRKVKTNCHVSFENNYYSVPSNLVGKQVLLRWNDNLLRIVCRGEQQALHKLVKDEKGKYVTRRSHLPQFKYFSQTEYQKKYEEKMAKIGYWALEYFKKVLLGQKSYWARSVRAILGLEKEYGDRAVNLALKRAFRFKVTNTGIIKNILKKELYLLDYEPSLDKETASVKQGLQRDLCYYQL